MEHLTQAMVVQQLKMMMMISGSVSSRNISSWMLTHNLPYGFPVGGYPGQGSTIVQLVERTPTEEHCIEEHADLCLEAGLNVEGINQEVACGQWEYQIFAKGAKDAGDELWVARYMLDRLTESYGYYIEWHPKPIKGDLERIGMHANFSNRNERQGWRRNYSTASVKHSDKNIERHMSVYGAHNEQRLTGLHETQSIDKFSYGVSDRGASIRVPASVPTGRRMDWKFGRPQTSI